jgi:hypothetical protein
MCSSDEEGCTQVKALCFVRRQKLESEELNWTDEVEIDYYIRSKEELDVECVSQKVSGQV